MQGHGGFSGRRALVGQEGRLRVTRGVCRQADFDAAKQEQYIKACAATAGVGVDKVRAPAERRARSSVLSAPLVT